MKIPAYLGFILIALAASVGLSSGADQTAPHENGDPKACLNLFFTGKRRSNLEPCGCRSYQTSGLQYEATLYDQYATSPTLRLDAGEWTNVHIEDSPVDAMKTRYLLRALRMMVFDAVNVGWADAQLSREYLDDFSRKYPQGVPNLVSANIFVKDKPGQHAFPTQRIVARRLADGTTVTIGLTGATAPATADRPVEDFPGSRVSKLAKTRDKAIPKEQNKSSERFEIRSFTVLPVHEGLRPVISALRPKVDLLVVLYAGSLVSARELARAFPQVDCLVINGQIQETTQTVCLEGRVPILIAPNMSGREVGLARLGRPDLSLWQVQGAPKVIAINPEFAPKQSYVKLVEEFKKETRQLDAPLPPANVKRIYAGARRCTQCHKKIYESWAKSPHAHALQTLVDKGQQFNPECLPCHVTGYRKANGFYSATQPLSQIMASVQCEACHSPAKEHADTQQTISSGANKWMKADEFAKLRQEEKKNNPSFDPHNSVCLKCHTQERDSTSRIRSSLIKGYHSHDL